MSLLMRSARSLPAAFWLLLAVGIAAMAYAVTFSTYAGPTGGPGYDDGIGADARFRLNAGIAVDSFGIVYVADTGNATIRAISPGGEVTTLAGESGVRGLVDGVGAAARFFLPAGLAVAGPGTVIVADKTAHAIRKISPGRVVTTVGGTGSFGSADGPGASATFGSPSGVAVDSNGDIYVADTGNSAIRKIDAATGIVSTFAGLAQSHGWVDGAAGDARFLFPEDVEILDGILYVADTANNRIRAIDLASGLVSTLAGGAVGHENGTGAAAGFSQPSGITTDGTDLFVTDRHSSTIRRVTTAAVVTTVTGIPFYPGPEGNQFNRPSAIAADLGGDLWVADTNNSTVRRIIGTAPSTFAGSPPRSGQAGGIGSAARFKSPHGIASYPGFLTVADTGNHMIRMVSMYTGETSVLAGAGEFSPGTADGTGTDARFNSPKGVAIQFSSADTWVADTNNHSIRKVTLGGVVTTLAGLSGTQGSDDGAGSLARFRFPQGLVFSDSLGVIYVADTANHTIREVDLAGNVTTLAGSAGLSGAVDGTGSDARFASPTSIALDSSGNLYVTDSNGYTVRKVTAAGVVTTLAGSFGFNPVDGTGTAARFGYPGPTGISLNGSSGFVADRNVHMIRTITTAGVVGTAGGVANRAGATNGTGTFAEFNGPWEVAENWYAPGFLPNGVFVADTNNHVIRFGGPEIADRAVVDTPSAAAGTLRQLDASPNTATSWQWKIVRRPTGSAATLSDDSIRNPTFTPDLADAYVFRLTASSSSGTSISLVTMTATPPPGCTYSLNPESDAVSAAGGSGLISLTAGAYCEWSATSSEPWLSVTSWPAGSGNGNVEWTAESNPGAARTATISVGTEEFELTQFAAGVSDDFSGDGKDDLFWRQPSTGRNIWWAMDGATRTGYGSLLDVVGPDWSMAGTGDFSGDLVPDLLWRNSSTGQNVMWKMNGTVRDSFAVLLNVPSPWEVGGIADFDGDSDADIVWRNPSSGQNVLWTMNGIVRSSYTVMLSVVGPEWRIGGVGDFDGDGEPDLVWRNYTTGQNVIWFMNGAARSSYATTLSAPTPAWRIQAVGDYDGDGKADIVWRNVTSGQNVIWFMDGATRSSFATTLAVTDPSWEMQSPK